MTAEPSPGPGVKLRFGVYEFDPHTGDLRKSGTLIPLQPQPAKVLKLLLFRSGEVVLREEFAEAIWGSNTFVDFEQGLNFCIRRLRSALNDHALYPRYIETVPRRGYRFVATVVSHPFRHSTTAEPVMAVPAEAKLPQHSGSSAVSIAATPESTPRLLRLVQKQPGPGEGSPEADRTAALGVPAESRVPWVRRRVQQIVVVGVLLLIVATISVSLFRRQIFGKRSGARPEPVILPLLGIVGEESMPAFSPDGSRIAFVCRDSGETHSGIYAAVVGVQSLVRLTQSDADYSPAWSPDGRELAFLRDHDDKFLIELVPALGGSERTVYTGQRGPLQYETGGGGLSFSPDGMLLAFSEWNAATQEASIELLSLRDWRTHFLTSPPAGFHDRRPAFSPDGKNVAFIRSSGPTSVEELSVVSTAGGAPKQLTFDRKLIFGPPTWTPDGREILFSSTRGGLAAIWRISAHGGVPQRISAVGPVAHHPSLSSSGRELAYEHVDEEQNLWRLELRGAQHAPGPASVLVSSAKTQNFLPQFSPDGRKVAFQSVRSGYSELWVCDADGSNLVQVTQLEGYTGSPNWSPDGRFLVFDYRPRQHSGIYVVEVAGGRPHAVASFPDADNVVPSWSRDGQWIYFASKRGGKVYQIWKVRARNEAARQGVPVQVTKNGGFASAESADGQELFYSKFLKQGLWAVPRDGGRERAVWPGPGPDYWSNWAITKEGVYFLASQGVGFPPAVNFLDFKTKGVSRIAALDKPSFYGLTVSADGHALVYSQLDRNEHQIFVVKNFR